MDSTDLLRIKFTSLMKDLESNTSKCYLEIVPQVSSIKSLTKHLNITNSLMEYTIPMTYKVTIKKEDETVNKVYHSCVDLSTCHVRESICFLPRILSDNLLLSSVSSEEERYDVVVSKSTNVIVKQVCDKGQNTAEDLIFKVSENQNTVKDANLPGSESKKVTEYLINTMHDQRFKVTEAQNTHDDRKLKVTMCQNMMHDQKFKVAGCPNMVHEHKSKVTDGQNTANDLIFKVTVGQNTTNGLWLRPTEKPAKKSFTELGICCPDEQFIASLERDLNVVDYMDDTIIKELDDIVANMSTIPVRGSYYKPMLTLSPICSVNTTESSENHLKKKSKRIPQPQYSYLNKPINNYNAYSTLIGIPGNDGGKEVSNFSKKNKRLSPQVRVAYYIQIIEKEVLPLKVMFHDIKTKCESMGLFNKKEIPASQRTNYKTQPVPQIKNNGYCIYNTSSIAITSTDESLLPVVSIKIHENENNSDSSSCGQSTTKCYKSDNCSNRVVYSMVFDE